MNQSMLVIGEKIEAVDKLTSLGYAVHYSTNQGSKDEIASAAVILIVDSSSAVRIAQSIHKMDDVKKIIFLSDNPGALTEKLQRLVTIGNHWDVCDPNGTEFVGIVQSAMGMALHRRKLRTTLHRAVGQLGQSKQKQVPYYRRMLLAEQNAKKRKAELEEKTKQLEKKVKQLEKWERLTTGRELRIVELKKRVKELEGEHGKAN